MTRAPRMLAGAIAAMRFALVACLFVLAVAAGARAESFITIGDVPVDVTAKSAAAARDQAIADAQRKAFDRLVKRLVANPADQARLRPSQSEIESFVQDFGVQSERASTVRYIGLFTVRFRAGMVRKYLADAGITNVGSLQQVLVIPVFRGRNGSLLWEQDNAWRAAWDRGGFGDGPVTLILPNGDSFDCGALSPAAAQAGDIAAIDAMIQRYAAAGLVVAVAEPRDPARGAASGLTINVATYDAAGPKGSQVLTVDPADGALPEKILLQGVSIVVQSLEDGWQQAIATSGSAGLSGQGIVNPDEAGANAEGGGPPVTYAVSMQLGEPGDWVRTRDLLTSIAGVSRIALDAMTRIAAAFSIDFAGDPGALQAALAGSGYVLAPVSPANAAGPGSFELRRAAR